MINFRWEHELESHRLEWCCRFCTSQPFSSEAKLSNHLRHRHPQVSDLSQLSALIKASRQSVDKIPAAACPLCDWDVTLSELNEQVPSTEILVVTSEQFRRHLGGHMEQLALFALPRSYKDEDEHADSNEAAAVVHSDSRSRDLTGNESMSWNTASSNDANEDKEIPDVDTSEKPLMNLLKEERTTSLYPWSKIQPSVPKNQVAPVLRYGDASSQTCTTDGDMYVATLLRDGNTTIEDFWLLGPSGWEKLQTTLESCSPRVAAAAVLVGNAFIIWGGDNRKTDNNALDSRLWLLNTSKT